ncbi:formylmethanofuran dehydrogenase subunit B [Candidatus Thorarchaeota archaeon]|nr:MAG: formylmethanofuran dehydrogenase subunit B [Candidatus Thorarchaeota archaeon]
MSQKISDVVCPFCGCLCDDIVLRLEDGKIIENRNGCAISKAKFLNHLQDRLLTPTIRSAEGVHECDLDAALEEATTILSEACRPLIYGLSSTENDAHREAYHIAELLGGVVDNTSSVCHGPSLLGVQESGEPHGALTEVRNRADLVIYWGCNPVHAHPRHISRFVTAAGEFVREPRKEREIWVIDVRETATSRLANHFINVEIGSDLEVLSVLRSLVKQRRVDVSQVGGVRVSRLHEMAERMKAARYGVLFYGLGLTQSRGRHRNVDAAIRLLQDLNEFGKWNIIPMRGHFNVAGANKTCTWTTGFPFSVDFSRGYPRYQPGEYSAVDLLQRGEADVLMNIAADPCAHLPVDAVRSLKSIPIINLDPKRNLTSTIATVNIPTAQSGIESDGVAVRMDGLPLYLKKVTEPPVGVLPDRDILRMIRERLEAGP